MLSNEQRDKVRAAFTAGKLKIQSVSPEGDVEWKKVCHVQRSEVPWEMIREGETEYGPFILTAGHRVFLDPNTKKEMKDLEPEDTLLGVGLIEGRLGGMGRVGWSGVLELRAVREVPKRQYMYDLTAEDWHNFVLYRSRVVISNSPDKFYHFRPPEHEGAIGQYNRVFGQIWEDAELLEYLERALDWWNMFPPMTTICTLDQLCGTEPRWKTAIYWQAIVHAIFAVALNWVADEFSVVGETEVRVVLPDGQEVDLSIEELHEICEDGS